MIDLYNAQFYEKDLCEMTFSQLLDERDNRRDEAILKSMVDNEINARMAAVDAARKGE